MPGESGGGGSIGGVGDGEGLDVGDIEGDGGGVEILMVQEGGRWAR